MVIKDQYAVTWICHSRTGDNYMLKPDHTDVVTNKWKDCSARQKAEVITRFLNECGEHATWEEWRAFLHKHHHELEFEWIRTID